MSGRNHASALVDLADAASSEAERDMTGLDARHVYGADRVDNRIEIRA